LYGDDNKKRNRYKTEKLACVVFLLLLKEWRWPDSPSLLEYTCSARSDVLSFVRGSLTVGTFPCLHISCIAVISSSTTEQTVCKA